MTRILVIIDNLIQYERIKQIFEYNKGKIDFNVDFRHSKIESEISNHTDFINQNESVIDVNSDCEYILNNYNLVISVHCFQFFPKRLVNNIRCINVHPGYNPINRGWYPQVFALNNGLPIGATIHEMDEKLDNGKIIDRAFVDIKIWDTSYSLYHRVLEKEIELFNNNFQNIVHNNYETIQPENKGNFFTKKNFEQLCLIDFDKAGTFKDFYNYLRALSHDKYKNAYFLDEKTGKKIFLRLEIEIEQ